MIDRLVKKHINIMKNQELDNNNINNKSETPKKKTENPTKKVVTNTPEKNTTPSAKTESNGKNRRNQPNRRQDKKTIKRPVDKKNENVEEKKTSNKEKTKNNAPNKRVTQKNVNQDKTPTTGQSQEKGKSQNRTPSSKNHKNPKTNRPPKRKPINNTTDTTKRKPNKQRQKPVGQREQKAKEGFSIKQVADSKKIVKEEPIKPIRLGITIGDINGIGLEIIIKAFSDERMFKYFIPILYGSSRVLSYHKKVLQTPDFAYNIINNADYADPDICNIVNCWNDDVPVTIGRPNKEVGKYAFRSLEAATRDMKVGKLDVLVTAPLNKHIVDTKELPFVGHTEYLTQQFGDTESLMFLVSDTIRVGLVTNHVPITQVASKITKALILQKIAIMEESLRKDFAINRPKIAVLALNPHAGDNGLIGKEEQEIIIPAIKEAKEQSNVLVFGPYAADGFFGNSTYRQFDAILAMYHDQGLIPFKALSFGHGVNFTAGLSKVRTSPDHGTAYDIAGKNIASEQSFRKAIFMAKDILQNRELYQKDSANPLGKNLILEERERNFNKRDRNSRPEVPKADK